MTENREEDFAGGDWRECLCWSLTGLSLPASEQLKLFPEPDCVAEEMADYFDMLVWRQKNGWNWGVHAIPEISEAQAACLAGVYRSLCDAGPVDEIETGGAFALKTSPKWEAVREAAAAALQCFGWSSGAIAPMRYTIIHTG